MSKDVNVIEKLQSKLVSKSRVVIDNILNKVRPINSRGTNHDLFILWSTTGLCNHFALYTAQATDKIVLAVCSEEPTGKKPLLNGKWEIFHAAIQTADNLIYYAITTYSSKNEFFEKMSHWAGKIVIVLDYIF